ncbi:germination lipoprotein GerS-related protein [Clostridium algidicarnis]|uniref:germination lipoprotein GerS-related protein n=1 Tax=Clostridium algidicarnis TaxID=37659 RepID=UPI003FD82085
MRKDIKLMILFLCLICLPVINVSCKKPAKNVDEVIDYIKSIKSYESNVEYTIKNSKKTEVKNYTQYFQKDQGYRLELGDKRSYIYKEDEILVEDIANNAKYSLDKDFDEVYKFTFIGEFIRQLYTNEDIKYFCKKIEGKSYMVVELVITGANNNLKTAFMYIDLTTNLPEKVAIFDKGGEERIVAIYKDLKINIDLDEELFKQ